VEGVTIHSTDPFAVPDGERSPVRRLRGRLASAVTLWTAIDSGGGPVGLTVSSTLVAEGEPPRLLGLVDEESALFQTVARAGRFVVMPLREEDRQLADKFAGLLPAPGGAFNGYSWLSTPYGPVLDGVGGWAGCRLDASRPLGWMRLLEATIERVEINPGGDRPLVHHRGRYRSLTG
jgi:flavin reductase (DIM6/NTAB) family NADH-FMN oxidoreductase RutF